MRMAGNQRKSTLLTRLNRKAKLAERTETDVQSFIMRSQFTAWIWTAAVLTMPLHAEYRTWTNAAGVKIEAELVKTEGENVTIRLRNGNLSTFPKTKLSEADIGFIKSSQSAPETPAAKPAVEPGRRAKWLTKMDKAKEESKETGLPILVLFTGTTWCPYCIKLEKEVFAEKEFKEFANQNLVLMMLDFPAGGGGSRKDEELQKEFGVKGFPAYFLTDADGKKLASGGYYDGITPKAFEEWVKKSAGK
jgi:thiol-disulfide isomerase/thioredoxin